MAEFGFTAEQERFRDEVREVAQTIKPGAGKRAYEERLSEFVIEALRRAGLLGLGLPAEYGGRPADAVTEGIFVEELSKVDFFAGNAMLAGMGPMIDKWAPEEVKREWLPDLATKKRVVALALTEANCGTDAAAIRTTAVRDGDDYIIDGEKSYASTGVQSQGMIVVATVDRAAGARGATCFLVPLDLPGVSITHYIEVGQKPVGRGVIGLDGVRCPARYRLGGEGKGFYEVMGFFDHMRTYLALSAIGAAEGTLEETIDLLRQYATRAGGGSEAMRFTMAEHAARVEAARLLCYVPLWRKDNSMSRTKEASMAKWLGPKVAVAAIRDCLHMQAQLVGPEELPVAQRLMDVFGNQIADGTGEACKIVICREALGRAFRPY